MFGCIIIVGTFTTEEILIVASGIKEHKNTKNRCKFLKIHQTSPYPDLKKYANIFATADLIYIPVQPGKGGECLMEKKIFYNVEDVMTMLMISKSHAYKIIRELNQDLKAQGYMTITGKVSCQYFDEKFYGLQTA